MSQQSSWFTEAHQASGSSIGFRTEQLLHTEKSAFQTIDIYQTTDWGNLMVIDGCVMLTTRDNFFYHEMMTHPALFTHARAKRVVIIGGGDCGTLREVLRHDEVEHAVQVEIDERVTRLAEQYFPELCERNADPRAEFLFVDGIKYMADTETESVDLIIVDSTDPVGPAEGLFNPAFYASCFKALRHGGLLVQQSESPLAQYAAIPAAVLPHRLVELHHGTQGRRPVRVSRTRCAGQEFPHALLQRGNPQGRTRAAGVHAPGTGRVSVHQYARRSAQNSRRRTFGNSTSNSVASGPSTTDSANHNKPQHE